MRKSLQQTIALLGVCIALLVWFFGYERGYRVKKEVADEKGKILVTLDKDQIQELEIDRLANPLPEGTLYPIDFKPEYETVKLRKSGSDWNLYHPLQDAADNGTVTGMIGTLTSTKQDRTVDANPKTPNDFGLLNPLIKIRVRKDAASAAEEVWVGANTPVGFNAYAKSSGSPAIYRVGRGLRSSFEKTLKDLRNKAILNIPRLDITEVEITGPSLRQSIVVAKDPQKDEWTLARENIPVELAEWNKTLNGVLDLRATDFPNLTSPSLAPFGLEKPVRVVNFTKTDKSKLSIAFGRAKVKKDGKDVDKVFAKRSDKPTVFEVDKEVLTKVEHSSDVYRSLSLTKFNRFDTQRLKLERGGDVVEFFKDNGKWAFAGDTAPVDPAKVDGLLTKLQDIKLDKYMTEHTPKMKEADLALTMRIFEKKTTPASDPKAPAPPAKEVEVAVLKFGKVKNKFVTVERSDLAIPFLIREADFKGLDLKKADLVQPEIREGKKVEAKETPVKKS